MIQMRMNPFVTMHTPQMVNINEYLLGIIWFQFQFLCVHLIHRGYELSDMELVNTETKVINIIHDVRYNTINFRIQLSGRHSDCNVIVEGLY
jgi:hypothetical protein